MAKCTIVTLAIISAAFAAPPSPTTQRIVGGTQTAIEPYPYMSSLQLYQTYYWMHNCGGSLLTSQTVLSAAHCFFKSNLPSLWRARFGSANWIVGGQELGGSQIILHENYNHETLVNDIAILKLAGSAIFSQAVQPVLIPPKDYNIPDGTLVSAVGWGALNYNADNLSMMLQHVDLNVINQQLCADRYTHLSTLVKWPYKVDDGVICTGILNTGGKDTCQGDSGGPVSLKTSNGHVVVGLTSWGYQCGHAIYYGASTRTSHHSAWIVKNGSL